jgi:hypothetical protein
VIVVALPPTGFPSFPHLRACPPPMRVAGSPQLTRPGGLVARRYGVLHDTRPHACERLHHRAAPPPLPQPVIVAAAGVFGGWLLAAPEDVCPYCCARLLRDILGGQELTGVHQASKTVQNGG